MYTSLRADVCQLRRFPTNSYTRPSGHRTVVELRELSTVLVLDIGRYVGQEDEGKIESLHRSKSRVSQPMSNTYPPMSELSIVWVLLSFCFLRHEERSHLISLRSPAYCAERKLTISLHCSRGKQRKKRRGSCRSGPEGIFHSYPPLRDGRTELIACFEKKPLQSTNEISLRIHPCSRVHASEVPALERPSDGLLSESIHSYHGLWSRAAFWNATDAARASMSSGREEPRMSVETAAALSINHRDSLCLKVSGDNQGAAAAAKASTAKICCSLVMRWRRME